MHLFCSVSFPKENGLPADTLQITTQSKSRQQLYKLLFGSTEDVHSNTYLHASTCPDISARQPKFWPHLCKLLRSMSPSITQANASDLLVMGSFHCPPEQSTEHSAEVLECHWHNSSTSKAVLVQKGWQYSQ